MNRSTQRLSVLSAAVAAMAAAASLTLAQPAPGDAPPPPPINADGGPAAASTEPAVPLAGTLKSFNVGPNGENESLILDAGNSRTIQVNFPREVGIAVNGLAIGESLKLTASPTRSLPDHPVYQLVSVTDKDGKTMTVTRPDDSKPGHVEGTVKALNYAKDGRVNGAILDNGAFVHVGPEAAVQLKLAEGLKVVADGAQRTTFSGRTVIDATRVNDTEIERSQPRPGERGPKPPKPRPDGQAAPPPQPPATPRD